MSIHDSKRNALLYSQANHPQLLCGKRHAVTAGIKPGDKVLDMGCGTGELTAILAKMVGKETSVIGVDPDLERIKLAAEQHSDVHQNITFISGDSSSQFPHFDKQYYDVHFSNFVFQWLNIDEKEKFLRSAFQILKPGGKIAIQSHEGDDAIVMELAEKFHHKTNDSKAKTPQYYVSKEATETLLRKAGFTLLYSDYFHYTHTFATTEDFLAFFYASHYHDETKISQDDKNDLIRRIVNKDGSVTLFDPTVYQIVARKD